MGSTCSPQAARKLWDSPWKTSQLLETYKLASGGEVLAGVLGRSNNLNVRNITDVFFQRDPRVSCLVYITCLYFVTSPPFQPFELDLPSQ